MAYGRGAWNTAGVGGTLSVDGTAPGPYYVLADGPDIVGSAGWRSLDPNKRAVHGAVLAIQGALTRRRLRTQVAPTGRYDAMTADAVARFQGIHQGEPGITVWAGVGPDTAKALFLPDLKRVTRPADLPWRVICGVISQESTWDPGAVGYYDPRDVGLAQINAVAHDLTERERLLPRRSFKFVADYLAESLAAFDGDLDTAIASYNLGRGGASSWVRDGRPDEWTPPGQTQPRAVRHYITTILSACAQRPA